VKDNNGQALRVLRARAGPAHCANLLTRDEARRIAAKAEFEYLYDKPYEDKRKVRVAGPFTVESLSPHRVLGVDENGELIDGLTQDGAENVGKKDWIWSRDNPNCQ
jgi:hypothetical protein